MKDMLHVGIIAIYLVVDLKHAIVIRIPVGLVENAQYHVQTVIDMPMQTRDLNNDAVVRQTVYKRIGEPFRHHMVVIVHSLVVHVKHWFLDITDFMTEEVNGHHGKGLTRT